jgi:hypothetical protein
MNDLVDLVISQWTAECPAQDFAAMSVVTRVFRLNALAARNVNRSFRNYDLHRANSTCWPRCTAAARPTR